MNEALSKEKVQKSVYILKREIGAVWKKQTADIADLPEIH